jgi:hypothetical protein
LKWTAKSCGPDASMVGVKLGLSPPATVSTKPDHRGERGVSVCRGKAWFLRGCKSLPARVAPAGSNRSSREGNDPAEASNGKGHVSDPASVRAVTRVNVEQASKSSMWRLTWRLYRESWHCWGRERQAPSGSTGVVTTARTQRESWQHGRPRRVVLSEGATGGLRRRGRAWWGVGWAHITEEAG